MVAAGWPRSTRRSRGPTRSSVPVQVNGKVRGRLTVPADIVEERPARAGAGGSAGRRTSRARPCARSSSPGGRLVSIVVSLMMDRRRFLRGGLAALALAGRAGIRSRAAGRSCRPTSRPSACRSSPTRRPLRHRAADHRAGPGGADRPRQLDRQADADGRRRAADRRDHVAISLRQPSTSSGRRRATS